MKIIQWEKPCKVHFHFYCPFCGCEWLAERTEVKITYPFQNLGPAFFMDCPNCGVTTPGSGY